ncbi:hypothetical protein [Abyssogena phaseoliformis symbiont]|uniref:hypothetical protein n=1 Tax=Abyssogena phaseoliformis symbiont TaxID=596095 RepID=UPI001916B464|nr:hypothetical protein [Abyssogena phaseoliformis symbiont]MBW5289386.1 hypothetical protein [Candidatus Ruthia sp. Apha_13_S6]
MPTVACHVRSVSKAEYQQLKNDSVTDTKKLAIEQVKQTKMARLFTNLMALRSNR